MITEYYVLNTLFEGGWLTADRVAPSSEWDDRWATLRMLETLENAGLVDSLHSHGNTNSYHISISGQYRLQQLREQQERELKTTSLLNELNRKLDQEREGRIAYDRQVAKETNKQQRLDTLMKSQILSWSPPFLPMSPSPSPSISQSWGLNTFAAKGKRINSRWAGGVPKSME